MRRERRSCHFHISVGTNFSGCGSRGRIRGPRNVDCEGYEEDEGEEGYEEAWCGRRHGGLFERLLFYA